jgi:hypothetical protein
MQEYRMDTTYLGSKPNSKGLAILIFVGVIILVIGGGAYLYFKGKQQMVSPIPPEPTFQEIFYTPTPPEMSPTSTPSATPKGKKSPTPSPKATATPKVTVTPKTTATVTPKASVTSTE